MLEIKFKQKKFIGICTISVLFRIFACEWTLHIYEAKITTKTWASLAKCSADTALRDIHDLVGKGVLREDIPGAKRPSYSIIYEPDDLTALFSEVRVEDENGRFYLKALYKGKTPVCERVLPLDAERFGRGDLPLENLLAKYCTYLKMN